MKSNEMAKILAGANLVAVLALGYGLFSINGTLGDRIAKVESAGDFGVSGSDRCLHLQR